MPHVHFHILPRKLEGDHFTNNDDVYPVLEQAEGRLPEEFRSTQDNSQWAAHTKDDTSLKVDADKNRKPRTMEDMEKEAQWLKTFFTED